MIKYFRVSKVGIIAFIVSFILMFISASFAYAQTQEETAKYNVTFPVGALGNCNSLVECKSFCDDPVNSTACISYAKSKGFYKEDALQTKKEEIINKAKTTLGCDSEASCMNFCELPANFNICHNFAQSNNLGGGKVANVSAASILEKAKTILGCDSLTACKSICEQEGNTQKCADFAKQVGIRGGERKVGPGGCASESSCKTFCSTPENFQVCSGFAGTTGSNFTGPGGCSSPEACKTYCQQNQANCSSVAGTNSQNSFSPIEMCNRTPNCSWTGSGCQCGNYGETRESVVRGGSQTNDTPEGRVNMCNRYGCTWSGNSCQCSGIGSTYNPEQAKQGCESAKGTWQGSYCKMPESAPFQGNADQAKQGCENVKGTWMGNYCKMPEGGTGSSGSGGGSSSCSYVSCGSGYFADPANNCTCKSNGSGGSGGGSYNQDQAKQGCFSAGGTWMGNYCNMPMSNSGSSGGSSGESGYNQNSAQQGCVSAGGSWNGSSCNMPNSGSSGAVSQPSMEQPQPASQPNVDPNPTVVQGVSTAAGVVQQILNWFGF